MQQKLRAQYGLHEIDMGKLYVPSGNVFCCDPFLSNEVNTLDRIITSGYYNVRIWLGDFKDWGRRVALAEMIISTNEFDNWDKATYSIDGKQFAGFRIDAGLACFMDEQTRKIFCNNVDKFYNHYPKGNFYSEVLAAEFLRFSGVDGGRDIGDWNMHYPIKGDPHNIAMFASGLGDGVYKAYWALNKHAQPVSLIADFGLMDDLFFDVLS